LYVNYFSKKREINIYFLSDNISIVVYWLKAITVEPKKQPLLENGSETTFVSRQRSKTKRFPRQQSARNNGETSVNSDEVLNVLTVCGKSDTLIIVIIM
jgi:hypothetical protein